MTPRNPSAEYTSTLAQRVAKNLHRFAFRAPSLRETVAELGAEHRFIRSGRPQTNGCVERLQGTLLKECWKPSFARYLMPRDTVLREELKHYLGY